MDSWSSCFDLVGRRVGGLRDCLIVWRHSLSKKLPPSRDRSYHYCFPLFSIVLFLYAKTFNLLKFALYGR